MVARVGTLFCEHQEAPTNIRSSTSVRSGEPKCRWIALYQMFIKDGPLAFFGQTANLHQPMRSLVRYLFEKHDLFLAGLEKSGTFVEHANAIAPLMKPSQLLLLDNEYIYKYIIPGKADPSNPYGRTTYYGNKVI